MEAEQGLLLLLGIVGVFGFNFFSFRNETYRSYEWCTYYGDKPACYDAVSKCHFTGENSKAPRYWNVTCTTWCCFVLTKGSFTIIQNLSFSKGDFYILLGNICWALYGVLGRKFIKINSPIQTTTYTMTIGAIAFMIISFTQKNIVPVSEIPLLAWGAILLWQLNERAWLFMVE